MFLRNSWYVAGWTHQVQPGALTARKILGEPIALYRKRDNDVVALEDRCCHRFAPLSHGRLEGDDIRCMSPVVLTWPPRNKMHRWARRQANA
jgi:phenylpropionate dioxygenase-like ring-hydroxylating dioxygenase large terminal subunit